MVRVTKERACEEESTAASGQRREKGQTLRLRADGTDTSSHLPKHGRAHLRLAGEDAQLLTGVRPDAPTWRLVVCTAVAVKAAKEEEEAGGGSGASRSADNDIRSEHWTQSAASRSRVALYVPCADSIVLATISCGRRFMNVYVASNM